MPTMKSHKKFFAAAAQKLAKKRSGHLQVGERDGMLGAGKIGGSKVPPKSGKIQASKGQKALNPEQQ